MRQAPITALNAFDADTSFMDVRGMKSPFVHLSSNDWLPEADYARFGPDLVISNDGGEKIVLVGYFENPVDMAVKGANGVIIPAHIVDILAGPEAPMQFAQAGGGALGEPIGQIETLNGTVTVVRASGEKVTLKQGDPVYQGDELVTGADGAVGVTFADESTMSLDADGRLVLDELVYDAAAAEGGGSMMLLQGAMTFVSGQIAKTNPDAMNIKTPVATIGIRGTAGGIVAGEGGETSVVLLSEAGQGGGIQTGEITVATSGGVVTVNGGFQGLSITDGTQAPPTPQTMSLNEFGSVFGGAFGMIANSGAFPADVTNAVGKIVARNEAAKQAQQAQQEADAAQQEADAAREAAQNAPPEEKAAADQRAAEAQAKADEAKANATQAETELNNATQEADQAVNQAANTLGNNSLAGNTQITANVVPQTNPDQGGDGQGDQGQDNTQPVGGGGGDNNLDGKSGGDDLQKEITTVTKSGPGENVEDGSKNNQPPTTQTQTDDTPSPQNTNRQPVVDNAIPDQTGEEGAAFNLTLPLDTFSDPDGDQLTYSATFADGTPLSSQGVTFDPATRTFSGTPAAGSAGTHSIKVTVTDGHGGSVSDIFDFTIAVPNAAPSFNATSFSVNQPFTSGEIYNYVETGDFNNDGNIDVVLADGSGSNVTMRLGDGTGSFGSDISVASGVYGRLRVGDLNNDGYDDVVVGGTAGSVYLNNQDNTFTSSFTFGAINRQTALGDVDGDGDLDLMVLNQSVAPQLYINDGSGGFTTGQAFANQQTYYNDTAVAFADFDGDGDKDVVLGGWGQHAEVWENDGSGAFTFSGFLNNGYDSGGGTDSGIGSTLDIETGDLDGDGDTDLYLNNRYGQSYVFKNDGDGNLTFTKDAGYGGTSGGPLAGSNGRENSAIGDLDGDGDLDIVAAHWDGGDEYLINDGTGSFTEINSPNAITTYTNNSYQSAIGDFNGDGLGDVFKASYNANQSEVLLNSDGATLAAISEDTASPAGETVSSLFGTMFLDADGDAFAGVAIAGDASTAGEGTWQYSTDSGTTWYDVGTVSTSSSLLLDVSSKLRFVPAADYNGTPGALTVYAVDDFSATTFTSGASVQSFDTTTDTSSSSVSASGVALTTSVTSVSDAPSFNAGGNYAAIDEDATDPTTLDVGTLIGAQFSDGDGDSMAGVAIAGDASTVAQGTWQYSTDAGTTWHDIGAVSTSSALLLDNSSHIRFIPAPDYNGSVGSLTLHAVDDSAALTFTSGATTQTYDTTVDDATSPVSASGISYGIEGINAINDAPVLSLGPTGATYNLDYTTNQTVVGQFGGIELGDLDGDGDVDAVWHWGDGTNIETRVAINDGTGTFTESVIESGTSVARHNLRLVDLDNDGDLDLLAANADAAKSVYLNDGSGNYSAVTQNVAFSTFAAVAIGDVNGDGLADFVGFRTGNGAGPNMVYINQGSGQFLDSGQTLGNADSKNGVLVDFDDDGDLDLFSSTWGGNHEYYVNDGNGNYTLSQSLTNTYAGNDLDAGDVDGDGDLDVVVYNRGGANQVYTNDGFGVFTEASTYSGNDVRQAGAMGDLDGDGDLDTIHVDDGGEEIALNDGAGTFTETTWSKDGTASTSVAVGSWGSDVEIADLNGDGINDIVAANYDATDLYVLVNTSEKTSFDTAVPATPANPFANMVLSDGDSTNIASATVTIHNFQAGDNLTYTDASAGAITGSYNSGTGILTFTGTATNAQYEATLQSIGFDGASVLGDRDISLVVADADGGTSAPLYTKITVCNADPIVVDLDGDGVETLSAAAGVLFDTDGDGVKQSTGWVAPDDGLMVADLDGDGAINDMSEVVSPYFNYMGANPGNLTSSADVLALYDDNKDGMISAKDAIYEKLTVWQDANSNGISETGELTSLADAGIESLNLSFVKAGKSQDGATLTKLGETNGADGSVGQWGEVVFDSYTIAPNQDEETGVTVAAE